MRTVSRGLESFLVVVCLALLASLTLLVVAAVVLRKFGEPLGWYDEVASIMLAWLTYYGSAYAALRRAHIGFPTLLGGLSTPWQLALLVVSEALVIGFFALVAWFGFQVIILLQGEYLASAPSIPVSLTQSVIPIGAVLFILAELTTLPERAAEVRRGRPRSAEAVHGVGEPAP